MKSTRLLLTSTFAVALSFPAFAQSDYDVETLAEDLDRPWGMAFLPDQNDIIITLRGGELVLWDSENGVRTISGAPDVTDRGQGGLLDIAAAPDFEESGLVYMTWAGEVDGGSTTKLGRARLDRDAAELVDLEELHVVQPGIDSGQHFGSRIVIHDGHVFAGFGDRGSKDFSESHISQDLSSENGAVIRLTLDGDIPGDNPFVDQGDAAGAIWSFGHRNIQAMTVHPDTGEIWLAEHGEAGGDEVNIVQRAGNFGWPLASEGVTYSDGAQFAEPHRPDDGFVAPVHAWPAGRTDHNPPSGMVFLSDSAFADWDGQLLIGNLYHRYLGLWAQEGDGLSETARLLDGQDWRIRDVTVGPEDGFIYVLTDGEDGRLVRLVPVD